jgi:hypothetical protein
MQPVLLFQTGCDSYKPFRPEPRGRPGPGLFSGEKGYFDVTPIVLDPLLGNSEKKELPPEDHRPHLDTDIPELADEAQDAGKPCSEKTMPHSHEDVDF